MEALIDAGTGTGHSRRPLISGALMRRCSGEWQ